MRSLLLACLSMIAVAIAQSPSAPPVGIENVAAFSRLYGVVRYFYPGDAAAALDWDRHAVYGVSRVLRARDISALETALEELFMPLGPGIEIAPRLVPPPAASPFDPSLVAWRYLGPGVATSTRYSPYTAKRTNRPAASTQGVEFVTIMPNPADGIAQITRPEVGGSNGQRLFRLRTASSSRESSQRQETTASAHVDFDVAQGLKARGNVAAFKGPGGFTIGFTGMRVTGHDGQTPHHLTGVQPDIVVEPTLAGVRDMRDEILERALAVSRAPW